jgi:hypothetical protein
VVLVVAGVLVVVAVLVVGLVQVRRAAAAEPDRAPAPASPAGAPHDGRVHR